MRRKRTQGLPPGLRVRSVVLRHVTAAGAHYDWLFESPAKAAGPRPLASFRTTAAPRDWQADRAVRLERLPDHRRAYLRYEGPISHGRGRVRRVDSGWAVVHRFAADRIELTLMLGGFSGRLRLRRAAGGPTWTGRVLGPPPL